MIFTLFFVLTLFVSGISTKRLGELEKRIESLETYIEVPYRLYIYRFLLTISLFSQNLEKEKADKVIFSVVRTSEKNLHEDDTVTYDKTVINLGNAMNVETGKFTAPFKGVYSFTFSGLADSSKEWVGFRIMKNDEADSYVSEQIRPNTWAYLTSSWMMQLNEKDTISINNYWGTLSPDPYYPAYFSGQLIMKEQ